MATIINPSPVTAGTFGVMWITSIGIFFPTESKPKGFITASLQPYDGTNLLATGGKRILTTDIAGRRLHDPQLDSFLTGIVAEVKRIAGKIVEPTIIGIQAQDPTKPVRASISFADGTGYKIDNCFERAAMDQQFGAALMGMIAEIGRQAELTVQ